MSDGTGAGLTRQHHLAFSWVCSGVKRDLQWLRCPLAMLVTVTFAVTPELTPEAAAFALRQAPCAWPLMAE